MSPPETILHADREHRGIEILVPLIILVSGVLFYLLLDDLVLKPLFGDTGIGSFRPLLRLVLAVVLGALVGAGSEVWLKRTWHSGRLLRLGPDQLTVVSKEKPAETIRWDRRVNLLCWRYSLQGFPRGGRERRVPAGHHLLACRLLQDDTSVIVHSYLSSAQVQRIPHHQRFTGLNMASLYTSGFLKRRGLPERPALTAEHLSGQQGPVWAAEKKRWTDSLEFDAGDFITLIQTLDNHGLMPSR